MNSKPPQSARKTGLRYVSENLYRLEPSGRYYAVTKRQGKTLKRTLKTKDPTLARARLREFLAEQDSLESGDGGKLTFAVVAERWEASERHTLKESTAKRRGHYLASVAPFLAKLTLRSITRQHCEQWLTERGANIAAETFNHELGVMKAVFNYAKANGWILRNPAQAIKRKRVIAPEITVPSLRQFQELVATIRQSDGRAGSQAAARDGADLVELLAYSGCRLDEARQLKWEHVTWPNGDRQGALRVTGGERRTKNHESRTVPMTDPLFGLLSRIHTERQPTPADYIVRIQSAKKCLATACKKLGFPMFTHHDLRHFFATTCIESGVDIPTISRWLGHKDGGALAMKRYGHLRQEHSFTQIKRVNFNPAVNIVPLPAHVASPAAVHTVTADCAAGLTHLSP